MAMRIISYSLLHLDAPAAPCHLLSTPTIGATETENTMNDRDIARIATATEERVYLLPNYAPGELTSEEAKTLASRLSDAAGDIVTDILQRRREVQS